MTTFDLFVISAGVTFAILFSLVPVIVVIRNIDKFRSGINNELQFDNWFVRQFISLFNKRSAKRWYESRTHLNRNIFVSLLCAFGLVDIVRFEFEKNGHDYWHTYEIKYYFGLRSYNCLLKKALGDISAVKEETENAGDYYELFIAGHNVAHDFMTV
jgi:hypothetical protein